MSRCIKGAGVEKSRLVELARSSSPGRGRRYGGKGRKGSDSERLDCCTTLAC